MNQSRTDRLTSDTRTEERVNKYIEEELRKRLIFDGKKVVDDIFDAMVESMEKGEPK